MDIKLQNADERNVMNGSGYAQPRIITSDKPDSNVLFVWQGLKSPFFSRQESIYAADHEPKSKTRHNKTVLFKGKTGASSYPRRKTTLVLEGDDKPWENYKRPWTRRWRGWLVNWGNTDACCFFIGGLTVCRAFSRVYRLLPSSRLYHSFDQLASFYPFIEVCVYDCQPIYLSINFICRFI